MFENIMKEYKKNSTERKFNIFYWVSALFITVFSPIFHYSILLLTGFILIVNFIYFLRFYLKVIKSTKSREKEIKNKIKIYYKEIEKLNIDKTICLLKKYNFKTKKDLKLALDYYNSEKPVKTNSNYIELVITLVIAVASFIGVIYNTETKTIDIKMLGTISRYTFIFLICTLVPISIIRFVLNTIKNPEDKGYSNLISDLSYIYLNFNKYKKQLNA